MRQILPQQDKLIKFYLSLFGKNEDTLQLLQNEAENIANLTLDFSKHGHICNNGDGFFTIDQSVIDKVATALLQNDLELKSLNLSHQQCNHESMEKIAIVLKSNTNILSDLRLLHSVLTDESVNLLAAALKENVTLDSLQISAQSPAKDALSVLCDALKQNNRLTSLSVTCPNSFPLIEFALVLKENKTLKNFDISTGADSNTVDSDLDAAKALTVAIARNNTLETIGFSIETIPEVMIEICKGLKQNRTLRTVDFSCCQMTKESSFYLAEALKENKTIRSLELAHNDLRSEGMQLLIDVLLKENDTLNHLGLYMNGFDDQGAFALANLVEKNETLIYIDIGMNTHMTEKGLKRIADALKYNRTLTTMDLHLLGEENRFSLDTIKIISNLIERNRKSWCETYWKVKNTNSYTFSEVFFLNPNDYFTVPPWLMEYVIVKGIEGTYGMPKDVEVVIKNATESMKIKLTVDIFQELWLARGKYSGELYSQRFILQQIVRYLTLRDLQTYHKRFHSSSFLLRKQVFQLKQQVRDQKEKQASQMQHLQKQYKMEQQQQQQQIQTLQQQLQVQQDIQQEIQQRQEQQQQQIQLLLRQQQQ
eukprot:Awhi_evm1s1493